MNYSKFSNTICHPGYHHVKADILRFPKMWYFSPGGVFKGKLLAVKVMLDKPARLTIRLVLDLFLMMYLPNSRNLQILRRQCCLVVPPFQIRQHLPAVGESVSAPLHQGQLRSMVGFPSTWLEINPSRLDFQPLVRNPTAGWYSTHWMVRIPTILPLCIKYRNLSRAPQIVDTLKM